MTTTAKPMKLDILISAIDKFTAPLNMMNARIKAVTAPATRLSNAVSAIGHTAGVGTLTEKFSTLGSSIAGVGAAAEKSMKRIVGIGAAAVGFGYTLKRLIIDPADKMQTLGLSALALENGNGGLATKDVSFIKTTALNSPFNLSTLTDAFITMRAQGLDPLNGQMQSLVDYVSKVGKGSDVMLRMSAELGHAVSTGKLQQQQMRALAREGLPALAMLQRGIARVYHVKVSTKALEELGKRGGLGAGAISLLFKQMEFESAGMGKKMSTSTFNGILNTLQTRWDLFAQRVMQIGDNGQALKGGPMAVLQEKARAFADWFDEQGRNGKLGAVADMIGKKLKMAFEWLAVRGPVVLDIITTRLTQIWSIADRVAQAFGGWTNVGLFALGTYIGGPLIVAVAGAAGAFASLAAAIGLTPAGWVLAALTGIAAVAFLAIKNWSSFGHYFTDLFVGLSEILSGFLEMVRGIFTFDFSRAIRGLVTTLKGTWHSIDAIASGTAVAGQGIAAFLTAPAAADGSSDSTTTATGGLALMSSHGAAPLVAPSRGGLIGGSGGDVFTLLYEAMKAALTDAQRDGRITVEFNNVPRGTRINKSGDLGMNISQRLNTGLNMAEAR